MPPPRRVADFVLEAGFPVVVQQADAGGNLEKGDHVMSITGVRLVGTERARVDALVQTTVASDDLNVANAMVVWRPPAGWTPPVGGPGA